MQSRVSFFKDMFDAKESSEDLKELLNDDVSNTTFDNTSYIADLQSLIAEVTQFDDVAFFATHLKA